MKRILFAEFFCVRSRIAAAAPILIQNATVLTVTKGTFTGLGPDSRRQDRGRGRESAGAGRRARWSMRRANIVMPGIIDCHSHIAGGQHQ